MTIDVSHSINATVCFQVVSIVMQWRGNREWATGPGQEVFELVRFYLLMLCSGTQPSARQAGGTIRCTVLFLMGSLPQSRFRFLHQRAHPPARPAAFFPSAAQCQCQPCQVTKKVSQALTTNARTQSRAQCCPQGGCMILSGGRFLKD